MIFALIPFFAVQVKRSRDIGWSGWFSLLSLLPFFQWIWLMFLGVKEGNKKEESFYSEHVEKDFHKHKYSNFEKEQKKKNYGSQNKTSERIITCPSCKQKLRINLPLCGNVGKCVKCLTRFELHVDEYGHIYVIKLNEDSRFHDEKFAINSIDDCFDILEISQNSTSEEIKAAYKKKIVEYHPDKVEKLGTKLKKIAEEESKKLNTAYSILKENGYV